MNAELRIGDAEREAAVAALGEHFVAGRLDKQEYDERTAAASAARTSSALAPLFVDLPAPHAWATAVSASPVASSPGPVPRSNGEPLGRVRRSALAAVPVLALLIALGVAGLIPWFVVAIVGWVWWVRTVHATRHRSRPHAWHQHDSHPWRPPVRR